ncbi:MAG: hypothetical protein LBR30_03430, partial [Clostridioides sp.]|nr:hypothetical protein [Clostridioides sp.]
FTRKQYESLYGIDRLENLKGSNNDYFVLAKKLLDSGAPLPDIYLEIGTEDWLYEYNVEFRDKIKSMGFNVTWCERTGEHNWDFWDKAIEHGLEWLDLKPSDKWVTGGKLIF